MTEPTGSLFVTVGYKSIFNDKGVIFLKMYFQKSDAFFCPERGFNSLNVEFLRIV